MFGLLKKKLTGFIDKLTKKEEEKPVEKVEPEEIDEEPKPSKELKKELIVERPGETKKSKHEKIEKKVHKAEKIAKQEKPAKAEKIKEETEEAPAKKLKFDFDKAISADEFSKTVKKKENIEQTPKPIVKEEPKKSGLFESFKNIIAGKKEPETRKPEPVKEKIGKIPEEIEEAPKLIVKEEPKKHEKEESLLKVGILKQVKSVFTGTIDISEGDVKELLDELELDLLESDVAIEVAESMKEDLGKRLVGEKVKKNEINDFVKKVIKDTIISTISLDKEGVDILEFVKTAEKPVKIMVLGTNGAGKTTTIGKIARMLLDNNYKVVFAAADTFRAAAIEQMSVHAERLGVHIIKRDYGADPTAVAYDAVNYSKAHQIDVVLIDTAGRQDTNLNLINELKKMERVIKPDLKLYVGESIAGNAIIEQVSVFKENIGIDGVVLTKLDCDAKGGSVLSISKITGVPIIYLGTGQGYGDLERFSAERIADLILS
ncbi:MAG: signal recognition particle-docking protein FtsY [Candidatus Micrarchaeota archaeon]